MPDLDVQQKVLELEKELAVVATKAAGVEATQSAAMGGQAATTTATVTGQAATTTASMAGLAAAVISGGVSLIVGIFLGMAIRQPGGRIYGGVAWLSFMECSVGSWIDGSVKTHRRAPPSRRTSRSGCWMDTASRGASL